MLHESMCTSWEVVYQNNDIGWTGGARMGRICPFELLSIIDFIWWNLLSLHCANYKISLTDLLKDPFTEPPIAYSAKLGELHLKKSFYNWLRAWWIKIFKSRTTVTTRLTYVAGLMICPLILKSPVVQNLSPSWLSPSWFVAHQMTAHHIHWWANYWCGELSLCEVWRFWFKPFGFLSCEQTDRITDDRYTDTTTVGVSKDHFIVKHTKLLFYYCFCFTAILGEIKMYIKQGAS